MTGDTAPRLSVVVPSYRSAATISACLESLLRQDVGEPFEVLVVDSSPDDTPALVRGAFPQVRLVHLAQQTDPAAARNIGAAEARGALLAFIDSDCVAPADWLRRLRDTLDAGYDAAGGAIVNRNGETAASWAGYFCEFREFLPGGEPRDADNLTLGNAAYRRSAFEAAGRFPTGCFPQEDQVFHDRFCAQGGRVRYDPQITVSHAHRSEVGAFLAHQRHIGRANARVLRRIRRPGSGLARRPLLALAALPGLVPLRFARTAIACRRAEGGMLVRRPALAGLTLLGQCWWGLGFVEGAFGL